MRDYHFYPARTQYHRGPSRLADMRGNRKEGDLIKMTRSKAPKPRFAPEQIFKFEGSLWRLAYMFRLEKEPGVWMHALMEIPDKAPPRELRTLDALLLLAGAGATTPRIVYDAFRDSYEVYKFFSDILLTGSVVHLSTQRMLQEATLV